MRERAGASRELSLIKLGALIHRQLDESGRCLCAYCDTPIEFGEDPSHNGSIDHVYPKNSDELAKAKVQHDDPGNLLAACRSCNSTKSEGTAQDWQNLIARVTALGFDWQNVILRIDLILATPIDKEFGLIYANALYPKRREYLRTSGRLRSLARTHKDPIAAARALDEKKRISHDEDDIPF